MDPERSLYVDQEALQRLESRVVNEMSEILQITQADIVADFFAHVDLVKREYDLGKMTDYQYEIVRQVSKELQKLGSSLCNQ